MSDPYLERMFPAADVRRILRVAAEIEDGVQPPRDAGRPHTLEELTWSTAPSPGGVSRNV
jgi:hypothetical protein